MTDSPSNAPAASSSTERVALLLFESRGLDTYPMMLNTALLLARAGYAVDILLPEHMRCELDISAEQGVNVAHSRRIEQIVVSRNNSAAYIQGALRWLRRSKRRYAAYFAAYFEGLAIATLARREAKTPIVYVSMELIYHGLVAELDRQLRDPGLRRFTVFGPVIGLLEHTQGLWSRLPGPAERICRRLRDSGGPNRLRTLRYHRKIAPEVLSRAEQSVAFSLVQDKHRERVLRDEFDFVDRVLRVPNSYIGFRPSRSAFAHERFGVPSHRRVILYSGAIERGFDREFFALLDTPRFRNDCALFVNGYSRDGYLDELRAELAPAIADGRLVLNTESLGDEEYAQLVQSSAICLAWYGRPDEGDDNMYYLGLSSGKMNRYLACGKPVVVPDYYYGYRELMERSGVGVACSRVAEIEGAIATIEADYDRYASNVLTFFKRELEFERCFEPVLSELKRVIAHTEDLRL